VANKEMSMKYIDLTRTISEQTVVYPGDPTFSRERISEPSLAKSGSFALYKLHLSNHQGTHIDYPSHVIPGGKGSSDYSLEDLSGEGIIIDASGEAELITSKFLENYDIRRNDIVFFKTKNSQLPTEGPLSSPYVSLSIDAAKTLVGKGVTVVGIDYLSVDSHDAEELPVHHILLESAVLIVEGLCLKDAEPGRAELIIAPMKIESIDGAPARVMMRK